MQVHFFTNGGFVVHRIDLPNGRGSAWYDPSGKLIDCEAFLTYSFKGKRVSKEDKRIMEEIGKRFCKKI